MIAEAGEQLKAFIQVCSIKYFNILLNLTLPVGRSVNLALSTLLRDYLLLRQGKQLSFLNFNKWGKTA